MYKSSRAKSSNLKRGTIAAILGLTLVAIAITAISISSAQTKKRKAAQAEKAKRIDLENRLFRPVPGARRQGGNFEQDDAPRAPLQVQDRKPVRMRPTEQKLARAHSFDGDLRNLPYIPPIKKEKPEREAPFRNPVPYEGAASRTQSTTPEVTQPSAPEISAPAPAPLTTFEGLDNVNWGAGHPPDTVGDVGPNHYIQAINTSIGIYNKSTGARVAAFTFDTFMSQGNFGNLCDTDNFGDPVVLYDTFEDRWVITDFAFQLDASDNVVNPPGSFQCFAVSKTGDPVSGGWNYYSINTTGGLGDYPKFGVWTDGLYMSTNMFDYAATGAFQNPRVYAFNKAQMYAGAPTVQSVQFDAPSTEFSLLPSNARLQTGTPPAGSPNYFTEVTNFLNVISVYKLKVDWNNISTSTFTGPFDSLNSTWWAQLAAANQTAPTPANRNDELYGRLMMQNQYSNLGGVESLWNSMTVGLGNPTTNTTATQSAVRYYQVKVTGGTVEANSSQNFTYSPADTIWRYMPSLAVDRAGNMALGFSTSNATTHPTISYAGRLSTDAVNSLPQTDQTLIAGTGSQSGSCGGTCTRWGDYSAMSLDPDGCTFWFTSEYYATTGLNHQTRIGSFKYSQCTTVGNGGTISGTVTANPGGAAIAGATVTLGSRTTTTDISGNYSFTGIPAGTYPGMTASFPGRNTASASSIVVTDGGTTTQNFSLTAAATSGCFVDTSQADFQAGIPTNTDVATSAGNVQLATSSAVDAQSTTETQAFGFSNTSWFGQTFTPTVSGQATQVQIDMFCSSCTGTPPNVVIAIRNASGNLPTGADLTSVSIPFSNSASGGFYTGTFSSPPTLTAGTQYAIVVRMAAAYATGTPAYVTSTASAYAGGRRTTSSNSGTSWTGTTPDVSFKVTMKTGFKTSGDFVSSLKDANPAAGNTANWGTFSWTATTPANTTLKFQAAASNSANGPFSYVGPDGTVNTFFTSGNSLSQFNGKRYLRYKGLFTSTNSAATPSIADVSVCFSDVPSIVTTTLTAAAATGTYGGTVNLSATLTDGTNGVSGKNISFTLNGNSAGSATTNGSGVATLSNVSLSGINAGSYPTGVGASFAGDSGYTASNSTAALTVNKADTTTTLTANNATYDGNPHGGTASVTGPGLNQSVTVSYSGRNSTVYGPSNTAPTNAGDYTASANFAGDSNYNSSNDSKNYSIAKANQTITFNALGDKTYGDADFGVSATASSNLTVSFGASGNCTVTGTTVHITAAGSCTITASQAGDTNYNAATDVPRSFNIAKANTTTTVTANNATYDGNQHGGAASVTGPAELNQGLTVSYSGRNSTVYGPSNTAPTNAGDYTASASYAGDSNYNPSNGSADYSIAKANQTITFGSLADKTYGDPDFGVSATASSSLTVSFGASGNCTVTGTTVHITGGGSCTITASQSGDSNYNAAADVPRSFNIAKADQTITFGALADKTYGDADFGVSASASSGLTVSFGASGNCTVTGSTVHITGAGSCTITASQGGDSNYNAGTDVPRTFNIAKADQTITFGALADKTYGDADFGVSASASSGLTVSFGASGNCTVTGSTVHLTGAGPCTITASQGGDSNYNAATDVPQAFTIAKGTATINLSNLNQTYDGTPKSVSATTNPAGLNVTITYTPIPGAGRGPKVAGNPTNAGSYTVQATIDDPNYQGSATDTLVIAKANATINVTGYSGVYDGNSHGATGTATGAQSEDLSSLLHLGQSFTNVPGGTANWTFDGDNNYNSDSGQVNIDISKATPTINWSNPADIIYGTALSGTQLNATGSVPGSFIYTPAAGTVLGYGNGHNLHAAFTPTDTSNYNNAAKDVAINVLSALLTTKMVVDRDPALVGYNHNYIIDIDNSGSASATSMTLSDPLPSQVRFTAVTTSQGSCAYNTATHTVNCTLGTVGIGGNVHIQLTTKTLQTGMLDNTATVNAAQWDPATNGNTASVDDLEASAQTDVSVSMTDAPDPIAVSQNTTYTIVVKNYNTPISATGVVLTDTLPASFQFVSATTSQGSLVTPPVGSTGIVTANLGTLAVNGTATITITVKSTAGGTFTNTATATENEDESNSVNNTANQATTVNAAALQKVLLASQTLIGGCQNTTGNAYLTAAAPAGGLTVNLSTTNLAGVTAPASVFIPQGQTVSPAFNVTTSAVATKQVGTVNATLGSTTVSRGLTVNVGSGSCPP